MAHSIKDRLKESLPMPVVAFAKCIFNGYPSLIMASLREARRFNKAYAKDTSKGLKQIESRMMYFTHQIEKGLSHRNFRYGFGKRPLQYLAKTIHAYCQLNPEYADSMPYTSALAALGEYLRRHEGHGESLAYVHSLFPAGLLERAESTSGSEGGSLQFDSSSKRHNQTRTYRELAEERHSIREFSDETVTYEQLKPALEMAMRTPSVCNRQPTRVRVILDNNTISKALAIQGGFRGYPTPPALILLTSDNRVFMAPQEHNEGYTDGGLFGMSLLLALEEQGIAACPLNTMLRNGPEHATRRLLSIPDNENLVMYIAVGHFPSECTTCVSHRFHADDIVTVVGETKD